ncbi:NOP5/NOP56 family protein [Methanobacterium alcaliphilum]|uniref:NOP5/NOP56 family protein n=1 Tax=Methanobacterium alcaliphilum TaxID=392018 RepID=UPI00200B95A2|nr:ATP-binding protein [Methanobacterium alcaliphilum]MCK9151483.1 ATP-binding protein [Methanobacterium alcaliphilum]
MKCYLSSCVVGFFAFSEDLTLLDYELFPPSKISPRLLAIREGKLVDEESILLNRIVKKYDSIIIETNKGIFNYKNLKNSEKFKFESPNPGGEYLRSNLIPILIEVGSITDELSFRSRIHTLYIELTKQRIQESSEAEDKLLIQTINAIDEIDESLGKLAERIMEWYGIHFPELDTIKNHAAYINLIAQHGNRDNMIKNGLSSFNIDIKSSMGAEIEEEDLIIIQNFAKSLHSLQESRQSMEEYVDNKMEKIAPNLRDLAGASLGAKLIAHVGSLKQLALFPSSTIQIIGAEKALFRHLKTGERPPKHGLIFQHPDVRGAKWWLRGKIARALASKISIAVRKDVFSGELDSSIKESFLDRLETIEKENPFPKRTSKSKKVTKTSSKQLKKYSKKKKKKKKKKK